MEHKSKFTLNSYHVHISRNSKGCEWGKGYTFTHVSLYIQMSYSYCKLKYQMSFMVKDVDDYSVGGNNYPFQQAVLMFNGQMAPYF